MKNAEQTSLSPDLNSIYNYNIHKLKNALDILYRLWNRIYNQYISHTKDIFNNITQQR